jgi:hypothetical protein
MPVIRTHSGRGRLLAAALCAYALLGCTDGHADLFSAGRGGAQNPAGHGAAGHASAGRGGSGQPFTGGNHGAADGGDGRADAGSGSAKLQCDGAPPWTDAYAIQEENLFELLNMAIKKNMRCADRGTFSRMPFPMMDDGLRCLSRQAAFGAFTGGPAWGKPPSPQQGPGHDPFDPSAPDLVGTWSQMSAASAAMELFSDSSACGKLLSTKYTHVGIGYFASSWAVTLAGE